MGSLKSNLSMAAVIATRYLLAACSAGTSTGSVVKSQASQSGTSLPHRSVELQMSFARPPTHGADVVRVSLGPSLPVQITSEFIVTPLAFFCDNFPFRQVVTASSLRFVTVHMTSLLFV